MQYTPDNWVVIKFAGLDPHYRVLAGWSGGYIDGDSWKMNSGITRVEVVGDHYHFIGSSQSVYVCHKHSYCLRGNNAHVWEQLQNSHGDLVTMMDEDTDWSRLDWIIS
jgi:hypothetical protein